MERWKKLEKDCYKYLLTKYTGGFSFTAYGESDSTKADIKVTFENESNFFIEIKGNDSQCCQFVLFPNEETEKFDVSEGVKSPDTENRKAIISYMDERYDQYCKVGTTGIPIDISTDILYGWVSDFYTAKNVKFFITKGREYIIFPLSKFSEHFDICASYRKKKSGSNEPNKNKNSAELEVGINENSLEGIFEFAFIGDKNRCFFHTDSNNLHKKRMVCPYYTYLFKDNEYSKQVTLQKGHVYEVRRLSNTANPNAICQLTLKTRNQNSDDLLAFENELKIEE